MNIRFQGAAGGGSDQFNRANGPLLAPWIVPPGSNAAIVGNAIAVSTVQTNGTAALWGTANPNIRHGKVSFTWTGYTGVCWGGPMALRHVNGINFDNYKFVASDNGGGEPRGRIDIFRVFLGANLILGTANPVQLSGFLLGGVQTLEWEVQPTQTVLRAYVNNILQCTGIDNTGNQFTSGLPGLGIQTVSGAVNSWDNFVYTPLGVGGNIDLRKRNQVTF
jgi:hypothetical protein